MTSSTHWQNRIVGHDIVDADQLLANERNPRIHPKFQQDVMSDVLSKVGWIQDVIVNKRTSDAWGRDRGIETVVDGHLRVALAISRSEQVPVKYVDLTPEEEATVLATFDPITALATYDREALDSLLRDVATDSAVVDKMLSELAEANGVTIPNSDNGGDDNYSRKIDIPIYEPSNVKPSIRELYEDSKTQKLLTDIQKSSLSADEKAFLTLAAHRHVVFNYAKIADLYAHGNAELQRLMEDSALVIIDFDRAIELGYVKVTKELAALYEDEYGV